MNLLMSDHLPQIELWLAQYDSEKTRENYRHDVEEFIKFAKKPPQNIQKIDFLFYLEVLKNNHSTASIARYFASIRSYWKFLIGIEFLEKDVSGSIKLPRIEASREAVGLTDDEVLKIYDRIESSSRPNVAVRDRAIIDLMLYNGLRRHEICNLKIGDVVKTPSGIAIKIFGKARKTRRRPIHPVCLDSIGKYLQHSGRIQLPVTDPLFLSTRKRPLSGSDIYLIVQRYAYGMRHIWPHLFRAKFASMALETGVPITSVQEDLGHVSIETTAIYDKNKTAYERSAVLKIKALK